jgi:hypothetical protein
VGVDCAAWYTDLPRPPPRTLAPTVLNKYASENQCSGSGIRCLVDPGIRDG